MNKEQEKRLAKLKPLLTKMRCSDHPAYYGTKFCRRQQCGFGIVCEACEELEHRQLGHHFIDKLGIDNLVELPSFLQQVFGHGLHYEEKEELVPNCTKAEAVDVKKARDELETLKEKKSAELKELISKLQRDTLLKIELRFKKLEKVLTQELQDAFEAEIRPLAYFTQAIDNINKKREYSMDRLLTELELARIFPEQTVSSRKPKKEIEAEALDLQKCSLALQGHLEGTYNYIDIRYMKEMRDIVNYLKGSKVKVSVDLENMANIVNHNIVGELEHAFSKITKVTSIENGGLEKLILRDEYPDNLAENISGSPALLRPTTLEGRLVDTRVRLNQAGPVTAVCSLADDRVVIGHQSGTLRVGSANQPDVQRRRARRKRIHG